MVGRQPAAPRRRTAIERAARSDSVVARKADHAFPCLGIADHEALGAQRQSGAGAG